MIHTNFTVSLLLAQLVFVTSIDADNEVGIQVSQFILRNAKNDNTIKGTEPHADNISF